jgi:hypothetical protein
MYVSLRFIYVDDTCQHGGTHIGVSVRAGVQGDWMLFTRLWLSCRGGSAAVHEGEERVVVGGLDGWYGVQADAFVGAVQALVVHAESCGGGDA